MMDLKKLIEAGVHFGHKRSRWHPKMAPYIWGFRSNIHLIDVSKTAQQLNRAANFLQSVAANGKTILWVGTKKVVRPLVAEVGKRLTDPYVNHRWIGGTLTNFSQVKKSITKLMHLEDVVKKSDSSMFTKKELVSLQKLVDRLSENVGPIRSISWPIGAIVVVDAKKEQTALKEAQTMGIPVVGIVDTNTDPSLVSYVIPANDDAARSVHVLLDALAVAVEKGKKESEEKKQAEQKKSSANKNGSPEEAPIKKSSQQDKPSVQAAKPKAPVVEKEASEKPSKSE